MKKLKWLFENVVTFFYVFIAYISVNACIIIAMGTNSRPAIEFVILSSGIFAGIILIGARSISATTNEPKTHRVARDMLLILGYKYARVDRYLNLHLYQKKPILNEFDQWETDGQFILCVTGHTQWWVILCESENFNYRTFKIDV